MKQNDRLRQIAVLISAIIALIGAFIGSGAAGGTPIAEASGGALSADATPVAPDGPAFGIWSVIYAGLIAYAIWQLLPAQTTAARHRRLGYPIALSLILNAAWILSVQFDLLWASVPVIVILLIVLIGAFRITLASRPRNLIDGIVTDGTVGLYLGWVTIATVANTAAVLAASGFDGFGISPDVWGVLLILVAGVIGIALALYSRGRLAPSAALSWGIAWVAVGRLTGDLLSTPTAIASIVVVIALVLATIIIRVRAPRPLPERTTATR
ncbi:tryptophan-rich sensory protein [Mycetocola zhadangensis]|uniref:Tryptophan-rich sensory protein n=1 Tax=Mycetocola zhadangensis TaxID=1164595 RepID=A0A3L7J102_9MICO|nr:tryptophan-rich sensory protein [Mycetocola zhadangensis]RLQ84163.1 tryptophan-rich sensory protein [Mycetocola zhadangensis]GGE95537.1 tryptophan-rich sensory protein [Mycetocola zhadangensis]